MCSCCRWELVHVFLLEHRLATEGQEMSSNPLGCFCIDEDGAWARLNLRLTCSMLHGNSAGVWQYVYSRVSTV